MQSQDQLNYQRIADAINFIKENAQDQPGLDSIAAAIHLSPTHFQKLFTDWAGTSPKKFLQYISLKRAKEILTADKNNTLLDATIETGLSSTSRLHDLFIHLEGMSPAAYKNGGKSLAIRYSFAESPFGSILVASTDIGICHMAFAATEAEAVRTLQEKFPAAGLERKLDLMQQNALFIFQNDWSRLPEIKLHLKGTPFQLKVWETLLKIPMGQLTTYGQIAERIGLPKAFRAVGTAIGHNPVAYLIPCHRVIQSTGAIGGYMWGDTRKAAIIGWEGAKTTR